MKYFHADYFRYEIENVKKLITLHRFHSVCLSYLLKITAGGRQFRIYYTQTITMINTQQQKKEEVFPCFPITLCFHISFHFSHALAVSLLLTIFGHLKRTQNECVVFVAR